MPYGQAVSFSRPHSSPAGGNTLTLTFIGDLDFQYNSCMAKYTIKLNNSEKTLSQNHR